MSGADRACPDSWWVLYRVDVIRRNYVHGCGAIFFFTVLGTFIWDDHEWLLRGAESRLLPRGLWRPISGMELLRSFSIDVTSLVRFLM